MAKLRFRDLSKKDIERISDGCGVVARGLRVPDFIFKARCDQHDFYTVRGTGWDWNEPFKHHVAPWSYLLMPYSIVRWFVQGQWYLQKANVQFLYWLQVDAWSPQNQILEKILYSFIGIVYWIAVSLWSLVMAPLRGNQAMRSWRTKEEIFKYVEEQNGKNTANLL